MKVQPLNSSSNSIAGNGPNYNRGTSYVKSLLEQKRVDLLDKIKSVRGNSDSAENNSTDITNTTLKDKLGTIEKLLAYMDNKGADRNSLEI